MKPQTAREIPLEYVLEDLGAIPSHRSGNDIFYFARPNDKKSPSFKIDAKINKWYDHGVGIGGNTIDAVIFLKNVDFAEAMKYLEKFNNDVTEMISNKNLKSSFSPEKSEKTKTYEIKTIKPIFSFALKDYLGERRIPLEIGMKYLKEVVYRNEKHDKDFYALAMRNDSNGLEIRNKFIKGNLGGKDITTIDNNSNKLKIFEGSWDFLSYITLFPEEENSNFIILNSVALAKKLNNLNFNAYSTVECYLDRDDAGCRTYNYIKDIVGDKTRNNSYLYEGYNDLNDYLQNMRKFSNKNFKRANL